MIKKAKIVMRDEEVDITLKKRIYLVFLCMKRYSYFILLLFIASTMLEISNMTTKTVKC